MLGIMTRTRKFPKVTPFQRYMKLGKFKGYLLAAIAAAAYGTNPAFAIPLYEMGMDTNSVLLFRYGMGIPILALIMALRKIDFKLHKDEISGLAESEHLLRVVGEKSVLHIR